MEIAVLLNEKELAALDDRLYNILRDQAIDAEEIDDYHDAQSGHHKIETALDSIRKAR